MPPLFTSFDEAWRWFAGGGELVPMADWRERLTAGRAQFVSFQAPVRDLPIAREIIALQDELADIDQLVFFDREMLHITLRAVGFQVIAKSRRDDVLPQDVSRIEKSAAPIIKRAKPIAARAGPAVQACLPGDRAAGRRPMVNVFPGALIVEVHDEGQLGELRNALGPIVDDAFGLDATQYLSHITIAMFGSAAVAAALRARLPELRERPATPFAIKRIELARWWFTGDDPLALPELDVMRSYALR